MSLFIISSCFLENINSKVYLTDVLFKFTQQNALKVGIDEEKKIIDVYSKIAESRPEIACWLGIMSYNPSSFEEIVKIKKGITSELEMFLFVCKSVVANNCIIVDTFQIFKDYDVVGDYMIKYDDTKITVLEKDTAVEAFKTEKNITNIIDSIVANAKSTIKGVKKWT